MKVLSAALLASSLAVAGAAHAATPTACQGRIAIDTVYQTGTNGKFEYYFQIRNTTNNAISVNAELGQFPSDVSIFSRSLPGISLPAHANKQIRFATGTNSQIRDGIVRRAYDSRPSGTAPYVLVTNCR